MANTIEQSLFEFLVVTVAAYAQDRVYPVKIPESNKQQPCVTYALAKRTLEGVTLGERSQQEERHYNVSVWGPQYEEAKIVAETISEALNDICDHEDSRIRLTWMDDQFDEYEPDAQLRGVTSVYVFKIDS